MRILVISDTHGGRTALKSVIERYPDIQNIFFLGDNIADVNAVEDCFKDKQFYSVSGNCDSFSLSPTSGIAVIDGVKIFYTHGHRFFVKGGTAALRKIAAERGCGLALFGHTHTPLTEYADGLYLVNPGSLTSSRNGRNSYAVIDVTKNGIVPNIIEV